MNIIIDYWYIAVAMLAVLFSIGTVCYTFLGLPSAKQKEKIKNWLVYACIKAEKKLGEKTGKLKMLEVYNMFVSKFPMISMVMSYADFVNYAEDALVIAKQWLSDNDKIKAYVTAGETLEIEADTQTN